MRIDTKEATAIREETRRFCARMMELGCDSVQVIATAICEGDTCVRHGYGNGNIFARYGAVADWLENQKHMDLANELAGAVDNEGED